MDSKYAIVISIVAITIVIGLLCNMHTPFTTSAKSINNLPAVGATLNGQQPPTI